jgi:hypothetical protein
MSAELWHLLFALAGALLGWLVRHYTASLPPEVAALVQELLARKKQQETHGLLEDLIATREQPKPPPKS